MASASTNNQVVFDPAAIPALDPGVLALLGLLVTVVAWMKLRG